MPVLNFVEDVMTVKLFETTASKHSRAGNLFPLSLVACFVFVLAMLFLSSSRATAQTGGEGGLEGSVVDQMGAVVPNATVTATNNATGVSITRQTTGDGLYTISPIIPGIYTVRAKATGFEDVVQKNLTVNAMKMTGLNLTLSIGSSEAEITVSEAPPALETTNATLGGVLENTTYQNLPLQMSGQQRDPTAFATLIPGAQGGSRAPIIGGTGNYLAAVYVDGIPMTTINQQGDNRVVSNGFPVEAIDQFQVITSTPAAEYEGAGLINFTLKSGGDQYHGVVADYIRNTSLDTWGFSAPALQCVNPNDTTGPKIQCKKSVEHQNEFVAAAGGPIPFTRHKGFFFATFDKYHGRNGINPNTMTVPTALMRKGDFTELGSVKIYDPTTTATCTAHSTDGPCRYQFGYGPAGTNGPGGNPVLTGTANVIPSGEISPIAKQMASYLPDPTNSSLVNNYLGGVPSGYDNHVFTARLDFDLTSKQRLSYVLALGTRKNVPFTVGGTPAGYVLPMPYTAGGTAIIKPTITDVEHNYQITSHISNQLKYGFNRFSQPVGSLTDGVSPYRAAADFGITNLPAGQASDEFPGAAFSATPAFGTVETPWTSNGASGATQTTVPNTYTLLDNLQIVKGQHNITVGIQIQWLQDNVASQLGSSGILDLTYDGYSTATFLPNPKGVGNSSTISNTTGGYSYASYLLGAVSGPSTNAGPSVGIQAVSETGGRYRDISPYVQDDWKVTPKLTLNLGLRWDYFPPFHEVQDRWSFLNPNMTNPITGTPGALQFAGSRGAGFSCQCRTPVQTYMKNWGPRIGLSYAIRPTTVIRGGYALIYSIGGGVGGRAGAGNGTGALGFNVTANAAVEQLNGSTAGPSFYLNNSQAFTTAGIANTAFGGPGFTLPTPSAPGLASESLNTGNYMSGSTFVTPGSMSYADPYLAGRAPEFDMYNFGIQQSITNNLTLTVNYAGTQSHFLAASSATGRGLWTNQINPTYLGALAGVADSTGSAPLLNAKPTAANVTILQNAGYNVPYSAFTSSSSSATIGQALVAFPQYSSVADTWGNIANISYNSLQVSLAQRQWKGLEFQVNYTWSKNMGDDGTFRSGYDLPAGSVSRSNKAYKQNRIDRSLTLTDIPQNASVFGVYNLPFGKGRMGGDKRWVRAFAGGWQVSSIYTYTSGAPLVVTGSGCTVQKTGQCQPDFTPGYVASPRINGKYGQGVTAALMGTVPTIDKAAFSAPLTYSSTAIPTASQINKIGNAARTAPYGLRAPFKWNDDAKVSRIFDLHSNRYKLGLDVSCLNVFNHPTKVTPSTATAWSSTTTTFGAVGSATGNRDFQLAARIMF